MSDSGTTTPGNRPLDGTASVGRPVAAGTGQRAPVAALVGELMFVLLPLGVLWLAFQLRSPAPFGRLLSAPDLSFGSVVLLGQAVVKLVAGISESSGPRSSGRIALLVSVVIAVLLAPALVVLAFLLVLPDPPTWLVGTQVLLFVVGIFVFLWFGWLGHALAHGPAGAAVPRGMLHPSPGSALAAGGGDSASGSEHVRPMVREIRQEPGPHAPQPERGGGNA